MKHQSYATETRNIVPESVTATLKKWRLAREARRLNELQQLVLAGENCCEPWTNSMLHGTDNEGYQSLISKNTEDGTYSTGSDLPPIKHCPWCGSKK